MHKIRKINDSAIFGVCGGIAYGLSIPVWIVRLALFIFTVTGGAGIIIYILFAIFMPKWDKDPDDYKDICC